MYPTIGSVEVATLTTELLRKWHVGVAKVPPRVRTKPGKAQQHREFDGSEEAARRRRSSANRILTVLRAALNHAFHDGKTASDAAWRKVKPFKGVDAARIRYLTIAEAKRLIHAADPEFRSLVQAALQTGCRLRRADPARSARLQRRQRNPRRPAVQIWQTSACGADRRRRWVFHATGGGAKRRGVVAAPVNGEAWKASHQGRPMADACERAKIKPRISFHGLRHTWASLAVMNGTPLLVVAKNLGHSDTRMVEKHYGHLAPSFVADAIRAGAPKFGFKPDRKIATLPKVVS